ncbi:glutathione S-transferase, C-terminal domain containing protein [Nitzschia inconspicua]|uniref:glutathione transferase n=1 Tax=Nitzschia inconspicua TaxID=303405 RepID=A0A9K3Q1E0_9STRA|nr:glutathione S-transferase, C-terminal domain containing protein [Nitzschia inconspicua]
MSTLKIKNRLKPDTAYKIAYGDKDEDLEEPRFILGYWSIRGLAAPLRMMLAAAEVNHWIIMYDVTEEKEGGWGKDSYFNEKDWLREKYNPLMNCPFVVDCANERVIVQTNAIFSFLGRELNMLGETPDDQVKCEELLCEVMDIRNQMVRFAYAASTENDKSDAELLMNSSGPVSRGFDKLEVSMKRSRSKFLVGDRPSAPDFHLWEMMDQFIHLCRFYNLDAPFHSGHRGCLFSYYSQLQSLPNVKAYMESDLHKDVPFNNPYARFGSWPGSCGQYRRGGTTPWKSKGVVTIQRERTNESGRKRKI